MNENIILKLKNAYHNKILIRTVWHGIKKRMPIRIVRDSNVIEYQLEDEAYRKLEKKYREIIKAGIAEEDDTKKPFEKIVWWCWLQGKSQAPELVKACLASIRKEMPDYDIRILDYSNIDNYVKLPDYIIEKHKSGMISAVHYSDIIRVALLVKYGGIWVDATVYCTGRELIPTLESVPLFVFRDWRNNRCVASSWFISSRPRNPILILTRNLLYEYWKKTKVLEHYYVFHLFLTMAARRYPEIWNQMPLYNNMSPHELVRNLDKSFSEERYESLKRISSYHKLNYKAKYEKALGSFYDILIRNDSNTINN